MKDPCDIPAWWFEERKKELAEEKRRKELAELAKYREQFGDPHASFSTTLPNPPKPLKPTET